MKIKVTSQVFLNASGRLERKFYVRVEEISEKEYKRRDFEFNTRAEVEAFLKGLEGK